jgi:Na+/H+-dicarboxylate symporter
MSSSFFKSLSFQIIVAMIFGAIIGSFFGKELGAIGELGKIVITLIKAAATPLLFFVILSSILTSEISGKLGTKLILINVLNSAFALTIGIGLSKIFNAGESLSNIHSSLTPSDQLAKYAGQKINFIENFKGYFPESFVKPFVDNTVISLIFIALILGFALKKVKKMANQHESELIERLTHFLTLMTKMFEVA